MADNKSKTTQPQQENKSAEKGATKMLTPAEVPMGADIDENVMRKGEYDRFNTQTEKAAEKSNQ